MKIELDPGESVTFSRSRDGGIFIIQKEDGTHLVETRGEYVQVEILATHGNVLQSIMESETRFWLERTYRG